MSSKVIIGLPCWQLNKSTVFAERLVKGLLDLGHDARILLTEFGCRRLDGEIVELSRQLPPLDLPCDKLAAGAHDSWGQRWEALERYLEERGPCFYLMLHDWRNNIIAPRLSSQIHLVGIVQNDHEIDLNQAHRLFRYWNVLIAASETIRAKLSYLDHGYISRLVTIPSGIPALHSAPAKTDGFLRIASIIDCRKPQHSLDILIQVVLRLADQTQNFHLTIFAEGLCRGCLAANQQYLVNQGLLTFAGSLPNEQLLNALADHHVYLRTTASEGFSMVLLESMSRACIPVVARSASLPSLVRNGVNAFTAEAGHIDGFVAHLQTLIFEPSLRSRLGQQAFEAFMQSPYGIEEMLSKYMAVFKQVESQSLHDRYVRPRQNYVVPQEKVAGIQLFKEDTTADQHYIFATNRWPEKRTRIQSRRHFRPGSVSIDRLQEYRVIVATSPGAISGVDTFSAHLVRGLRKQGIDARLLSSRADDDGNPIRFADDLALEIKDPRLNVDFLGWKQRWQIMLDHLERLSPCIYLPNYDDQFSCIAPRLSSRVRVVGIAHSDDPWHYEHLSRIGHACDGIVGVSKAITDHLGYINPDFRSRLVTIPYGVPPSELRLPAWKAPPRGGASQPLRIIYTGRLIPRQKRVLDILAIARALEIRNVYYELIVVGEGELRYSMERKVHDLIRSRKVWFTGAQPHDGVLSILQMCDVFLLPSAFEGLSVSMLEAMGYGLVPVVSDVRSGVPDVIVNGFNGLVAPVGDIEYFADHLQWLWRHPLERCRIADAAASTVNSDHLLDLMISRYMLLFSQVISEPCIRPFGPIVPPPYLQSELKLSSWATRVALNPGESLNRLWSRFFNFPR